MEPKIISRADTITRIIGQMRTYTGFLDETGESVLNRLDYISSIAATRNTVEISCWPTEIKYTIWHGDLLKPYHVLVVFYRGGPPDEMEILGGPGEYKFTWPG